MDEIETLSFVWSGRWSGKWSPPPPGCNPPSICQLICFRQLSVGVTNLVGFTVWCVSGWSPRQRRWCKAGSGVGTSAHGFPRPHHPANHILHCTASDFVVADPHSQPPLPLWCWRCPPESWEGPTIFLPPPPPAGWFVCWKVHHRAPKAVCWACPADLSGDNLLGFAKCAFSIFFKENANCM